MNLEGKLVISELRDVEVVAGTSHVMVTLRWLMPGIPRSHFYDTGHVAHVPVSTSDGKLLKIGQELVMNVNVVTP